MGKKIQHKRGLKKDIPKLATSELGFTTDTEETYIGTNNKNIRLLDEKDKKEIESITSELVKTLPISIEEDNNYAVNIEHYYDQIKSVEYWLTTITPKNSDVLKTLLKKSYAKSDGLNFDAIAKESVHRNADRNKASIAINASGWITSQDNRIVGVQVKDGVVQKDSDSSLKDWYTLGVDKNGLLHVFPATITGKELVNNYNIVNTWAFSIPLIMDGKEVSASIYDSYASRAYSSYPRQVIGQRNGTNEIIILTVDGNSSRSQGLTLPECTSILLNKGCRIAYNLDGGGSVQTFYDGDYLNAPSDGTFREVSDILYIPRYNRYEEYLDIQKQIFDAMGSSSSLKKVIDKGQKTPLTNYDGTVEYTSEEPFNYDEVKKTKFFRRYNSGIFNDFNAPFPDSVDVYGINMQSKSQSRCQVCLERKTGGFAFRFNNNETWGNWVYLNRKSYIQWKNITLENGWTNYGGSDPVAAYSLKNDIVHVKGVITGGTSTSGTKLFTLPVGCRPKERTPVPVYTDNGTLRIWGRIFVHPNGDVTYSDGGTNWLYINFNFPAEQ